MKLPFNHQVLLFLCGGCIQWRQRSELNLVGIGASNPVSEFTTKCQHSFSLSRIIFGCSEAFMVLHVNVKCYLKQLHYSSSLRYLGLNAQVLLMNSLHIFKVSL